MTTDLFRRYGNLLRSDGTNQQQRLLPALEADYIVPDERSFSDLIEYARRVAAEIRFYDLSGQSNGDWRPFVELLLDPVTGEVLPTAQLESILDTRSDWPPHLVLFLAFLKQFQHLQGDLNLLTQRHLQHYYEKELGLLRRAPSSDDVHVIFELAKNAPATLVPAGTLLDAGKDDKGRALTYATQNDLVVSAARVSGIRRVVREEDLRGNRRFFVADGFSELEGSSRFTFGRPQLDLDPGERFMTEAPAGFAVAAPILSLAEGDRTITLVAHLSVPPSQPVVARIIGTALEVTLTGAKGWLPADTIQASLLADDGSGKPALSLVATLGAGADAVVAFDPALHGPGPALGRPLLRCLIKGETGIYDVLDGLEIETIDLAVAVKGLRTLVVQNADGPLNASQDMPLFGSQPQIGAPFYIGSAEAFGKRLTSLSLHLEWKSPPENLLDHYSGYLDNFNNLTSSSFQNLFTADVDLLYERTFRRITATPLFAPVPTDRKTVSADASAFNSAFGQTPYLEQPDLEQPESYTTGSLYGFLRLVLRSPTRTDLALNATTVPFEAFGHNAFSRRYTNQAIALSRWDGPPAPQPTLPNEPYTPVLKSLSIDYTAIAGFVPGDVHSASTFLTVGPFGATRAREGTGAPVVPRIDGKASLYLGIEHLQPPANLSLFFQIEVGTASGAEVLRPGDTEWSYLGAGDSWRALNSSAVLIDTTQGFQKPGLIAIAVPRGAALEHDSLPSGLVWLRAQIERPPESASRTIDVKPHGALARFQPGVGLTLADYEQHLVAGLAPGTIARLVQRNASIQRVSQPDRSFDGRGQEGTTGYFQRSSERLRHRDRAVTAWDLERHVLEAFPEVFKVKCLPHTDATPSSRAGHAALVIVPRVRPSAERSGLEPRAGTVLMDAIAAHLEGLTSAFAALHVMQPVFERLRVEANVVFMAGRDPGYYSGVLNDDLRRFLSPWAYQEGEDILFGARVYRSDILAFVEGRDYVDHVTDLKLYHSFDGPARGGIGSMAIGVDFFIRGISQPAIGGMAIGDDFVVGQGVEVAEATQPHAILVSHPEHLITSVSPGSETCPGAAKLGIGYMTVGLDFVIQPEPAS